MWLNIKEEGRTHQEISVYYLGNNHGVQEEKSRGSLFLIFINNQHLLDPKLRGNVVFMYFFL